MNDDQSGLENTLLATVLEYGYEQASAAIQGMNATESLSDPSRQRNINPNGEAMARSMGNRSKPTAPRYVANMDLPSEKAKLICKLARKFQENLFSRLPETSLTFATPTISTCLHRSHKQVLYQGYSSSSHL